MICYHRLGECGYKKQISRERYLKWRMKMSKKNSLCVLLVGIVLGVGGCGNQTAMNRENESSNATILEETTVPSENGKHGAGNEIEDENAEINSTQGTEHMASYTGTPYTWNEITITIPDAWNGKYLIEENRNGFYFLQKSSHEKEEEMGYLCGFSKERGPVFAGAELHQLAYTDQYMYFMNLPSDVSYFYEDKEINKEYNDMSKYIVAMSESMVIKGDNVQYHPDEYVMPMSDTCLLQKEDLSSFNINELWIARNEIFARHGIGFKNGYLQSHFNSCSWYEPGKKLDQFNESELNDIEVKNLDLIKAAEKEYNTSHPYPMKEKVGEEILIDLNQDGMQEKVLYEVEKVTVDDVIPYEDEKCYLTIDGKKYDLDDYGLCPETPDTECFYITDISPYFSGLEIALLDYGPSADEVTHFATYDGDLHSIGSVEGFPMKDMSFIDGFANENNVTGVMRVDVIESCYGFADWWYDHENKQLVLQDIGNYTLLPEESKKLYVNLPVYTEMDLSSPKKLIPAQDEVFFLSTDGKEWVQVKGKDGSKGYMHVIDYKIDDLDKEASEVFSNLAVFG